MFDSFCTEYLSAYKISIIKTTPFPFYFKLFRGLYFIENLYLS